MKSFVPTVAMLGYWTAMVGAAAVPSLEQRQAVNCADFAHQMDPSCWATLGVTDYLQNWKRTTTCQQGDNFAACFLKSVGLDGTTCSQLQASGCEPPSTDHFTALSSNQAQSYYVAYAIFAVNANLLNYYTALNNANSLASTNVQNIVNTFDPPTDQNGLLNDLLTALSVGLSIIPDVGPELAAAEKAVADALVKGANAAPTVGHFLFPTGTLNSQIDQFAKLDSALGQTVNTMLGLINQAYTTMIGDSDSFLAFTQDGAFSQAPPTSLFSNTQSLLYGLNTYVISQAMQANKIVIGQAVGRDINAIAQGGKIPKGLGIKCGSGYDSEGICDNYWYDSANDITYSMVNTAHQGIAYHDIMETIFSTYTTGALLFGGGAACANAGQSGKPGQIISVGSSGVTTNCLSNGPICDWDLGDTHSAFSNCQNPGGWGETCTADSGISIPQGYVGPLLTPTSAEFTPCR